MSLAGAEASLREEIEPDASVSDVAEAGARAWGRELRTIRVGGGSAARRQTFCTALYHALMQPNLISDTDGRHWGVDQAIHRLASGQRAQYSNFSGWDQYRPRSSCSPPEARHRRRRIDAVDASQLPGLTGFALHLHRDFDAVTAGLTLDWSSGATEGAVNRIKKIKKGSSTAELDSHYSAR